MADSSAGDLTLRQLPDAPCLTACWLCDRPMVCGAYLVAVELGGDRRSPLCGSCAGVFEPELAACCSALNVLAATAGDLAPEHSIRVVCSLVEEIAKIAGPTLALLDVPNTLISKIERLTRS